MSSGRSGCSPGAVMKRTIRSAQRASLSSAAARSAAGKRRLRSASSGALSSPSAVMQMPRSVAAISAQPSAVRTHGKADGLAAPAVTPHPRGHAEPRRRRLIGPRAGPEPGGIDRLGDVVAGVEPVAKAAEPVRLAPFARGRAGDLLEHAVEMIAADPAGARQLVEARQAVAGRGSARRRARPRRCGARPASLRAGGSACTGGTRRPRPRHWSRRTRRSCAAAGARRSPAGNRPRSS